MEHLLRHLEKLKQSISSSDTRIWECVNNSWAVLSKYYELTDNNHSVYAAATLLYLGMQMQHFYNNWTGETANRISIMEAKCRDTWSIDFLLQAPEQQLQNPGDAFLRDLMGFQDS
jgi:hypothetical protein